MTCLVATFVLIVVLGLGSRWILNGPSENLFFDLYQVIGLFLFSGDWAFQEPTSNFVVVILAFVAPLLTIVGVLEVLTKGIIDGTVRTIHLRTAKDHVIVVGLDSKSTGFVIDAQRNGRRVVVLARNPDADLAARCKAVDVPVIDGDPTDPGTLSLARLRMSERVVSFLADEGEQLDLVQACNNLREGAEAEQQVKKSGQGPNDFQLWLHVSEPDFAQRLDEYVRFEHASQRVHARFFNSYELAARQLLRAHWLDVWADALNQDRIHVAIYGFGRMGEHVLTEAVRQCVTRSRDQPMFTIFDRHPEACKARFFAARPEIDRVAELKFEPMVLQPSGFDRDAYDKIPHKVTAHVICLEKEEDALAAAISLRTALLDPPDKNIDDGRRLNAPVFVRIGTKKGLGRLLRSNVDDAGHGGETKPLAEIPDALFQFGAAEDLFTLERVVDAGRETMASKAHEYYGESLDDIRKRFRETQAEHRPADLEWEKLPQGFRDSNRQQVDHAWVKARAVRCCIVRARTDDPVSEAGTVDFTDDEMAQETHDLAYIEHVRWQAERYASGWRSSETRFDATKRHKLLVGWDDLPDAEQQLDEDHINKIPWILASGNYAIKRQCVVGMVGHRQLDRLDQAGVRGAIKAALSLVVQQPEWQGCELVMLNCLAEGADTIGAEVAYETNPKISVIVPLPLPFELYRQDFEGLEAADGALDRFLTLVGKSRRYLELPLRAGKASDLSRQKDPDKTDGEIIELRAQQYARAGAYIVERVDVLIAVWDGQEAAGEGGTGQLVEWRSSGIIPLDYRSRSVFAPRPQDSKARIVIPARPEADFSPRLER